MTAIKNRLPTAREQKAEDFNPLLNASELPARGEVLTTTECTSTIASVRQGGTEGADGPCKAKILRAIKLNQKKTARLVALWPTLFSVEKPKPIKIGIHTELLAAAKDSSLPITDAQIRACLATYANRYSYLVALCDGGYRYDIDGKPCGEVTVEEREKAREVLLRRKNGKIAARI